MGEGRSELGRQGNSSSSRSPNAVQLMGCDRQAARSDQCAPRGHHAELTGPQTRLQPSGALPNASQALSVLPLDLRRQSGTSTFPLGTSLLRSRLDTLRTLLLNHQVKSACHSDRPAAARPLLRRPPACRRACSCWPGLIRSCRTSHRAGQRSHAAAPVTSVRRRPTPTVVDVRFRSPADCPALRALTRHAVRRQALQL